LIILKIQKVLLEDRVRMSKVEIMFAGVAKDICHTQHFILISKQSMMAISLRALKRQEPLKSTIEELSKN
jgi:hypothetical protein